MKKKSANSKFSFLYKDDKESFQVFVNENYNPLFNFVNAYVHNSENSKDIIQDTFIKFWQKRKDLIPTLSPSQYLFSIARNLCIDFFRKQKIENQYLFSLNRTDYFTLTDDSLKKLIQNEFMSKVEDAVQSLPEQCQIIFRMHRFEGLSYREIARKKNISEKTVENQISKALKILRVKINRNEF